VKSFSEKNDFFENIFRRLARTKKLRNAKIRVWQMMSKSGNVRSPLLDSGEQVWPDWAKMAGFQPDPSRFGRILDVLAKSGQISCWIRPDPAGSLPFWPDPTGIWSSSISRQWPDVAGFQHWQVFGDRTLPDSGTGWFPTTN
jgi:hypothetical protein